MTTAKDPLRFFRVEAREISEDLGRTVLALERSPAQGQVARLLRLAHTLKGASAVVRQRDIAEQAHALEDALMPFRNREGAVTKTDIERILQHTDAIASRVIALTSSPAQQNGAQNAATDEPVIAPTSMGADVDAFLEILSEANVVMRTARQSLSLIEQGKDLCVRLEEAASGSSIGVQSLSGELRETLGRLDQKLKNSLDGTEREMVQAHSAAERLRLLPCSAVFSPVERAVRDAASALGKQVRFSVKGGDSRLDPSVLSWVQRALLQLARNAVAHGIEPPDDRLRIGKSRQGRVELDILRRGNRVIFVCCDDGRGIDIDAVRRAATQTGQISVEQDVGHDEILRTLFKGGVSTADAVTEISGRGIGLDIAREVVTRLGGEISARTKPGQGTEIELSVPVSLSAMDVLLVEADGTVCAVPLDAVRGSLMVTDVMHTAQGDCVTLEGAVITYVPLARILKRNVPVAGISKLAFLVGVQKTQVAIGVDRLLGVGNIVVRPVPELSFADPIIAGGSVDGEGVPRLVLDPEALVAAASGMGGEMLLTANKPTLPILVIDDSLTTRSLEQSILESAGYEVDLATSAEDGLTKAHRRRYGLFMVDVEMPGMNGFQFISTIRADPLLRDIPAILVTSLNAPEDRQRGIDAGAQAYVVKGEFNQVKVLETIRQCLEAA